MLRSVEGFPTQDIGCGPMPFLDDRSDRTGFAAAWEELTAGPVPILDIPGNHFEPFETSNVSDLSLLHSRIKISNTSARCCIDFFSIEENS